MNESLQLFSALASIISIPLAVYFSKKNVSTTSDKARLDILKTLSYRLRDSKNLSYDDIHSVYSSKLREHKIKNPKFDIQDILDDLKSDIMSNAFLENQTKDKILETLSSYSVKPMFHEKKYPSKTMRLLMSPLPSIALIISSLIFLVCRFEDVLDVFSGFIQGFDNGIEEIYWLFHWHGDFEDIPQILLLLVLTAFIIKKYLEDKIKRFR